MVAILALLLASLHILGSVTALPLQSFESQIVLGAQDPVHPQHERARHTSHPSGAALQYIEKQTKFPVAVRYSSVDNRGDESEAYVFKSGSGKQLLSTSSIRQQGAWICREQSDLIWCRSRPMSSSELSMDAYSESVLFCRGIAVLIISTILIISVVALLCFRIWTRWTRTKITGHRVSEEKRYMSAVTCPF